MSTDNNQYFLQRNEATPIWEEVDFYVWENWQHVIKDNKSRYTGNRVSLIEGTVSILAENLTPADFSIITRFCGLKINEHITPGGFVREPEYVRMKRGRREWIHELGGQDFVAKIRTPEPKILPFPSLERVE